MLAVENIHSCLARDGFQVRAFIDGAAFSDSKLYGSAPFRLNVERHNLALYLVSRL
jgi:hypothetical protein